MTHTIPGLGQRVRMALAFCNITQAQAAKQLGVSRDVLTRMVVHDHAPNALTIKKLCGLTGHSSDWLLGLLQSNKNVHFTYQSPAND